MLPAQKRERLQTAPYNLDTDSTEMYVHDDALVEFFEAVVGELLGTEASAQKVKLASNYILNSLISLKGELNHHVTKTIPPSHFAEIVQMAHDGDISSNGAVELIGELATAFAKGTTVRELASTKGLLQENNEEKLSEVVEKLLEENQDAVLELREGKEQALQFLVGQGMKLSKGTANPVRLKELIQDKLG